jgi:hypothetical protein
VNYLELVEKAVEKSGAREDVPTTVVGTTGMLKLFVSWVADAWEDLKLESNDWWFRQLRDQTVNVTQSTDEYSLGATLDSLNERTVSIYQTGQGVDETPLEHIRYEDWRMVYDTRNYTESTPRIFTVTPDNKIGLFPVPDGAYTLRFDAVRAIQTLDNTNNADTPTGLPESYHNIIVWSAVMKYAAHYEDGSKFSEAEAMFNKYHERIEARQKPRIGIESNQLYRNRRF